MRISSPLPGQRLALVEFDQPHEYEDRRPPIMDAPLEEATVITSLVDGRDLHRPILDIDHAVSAEKVPDGSLLRLWLTLTHTQTYDLAQALDAAGLGVKGAYTAPNLVTLTLTARVFVVPSTTPGHGHLYVDHHMMWETYQKMLNQLVDVGVLEPGYVGASEARGWTCVRLPWVRK